LLQNTQAVFVQIFAGPVYIEYEHRHGGAKWWDFAAGTFICRLLERQRDPLGSSQVKTPFSRSSALLSWVTLPDQRLSGDDLDDFGIADSLFIFRFLMDDVLSN